MSGPTAAQVIAIHNAQPDDEPFADLIDWIAEDHDSRCIEVRIVIDEESGDAIFTVAAIEFGLNGDEDVTYLGAGHTIGEAAAHALHAIQGEGT